MQKIKNFWKIELHNNSKNPMYKWTQPKNQNKTVNSQNYGILTGKVNKISVFDLDSPKWKDPHIFTKDYPNFITKFNTLTVKTRSGGYHLFFNYDEELKTTTNQNLNIDVRNNGAYVVGPGSIIDGNQYVVIQDAPIQDIPKEFKDWLLYNIYNRKKIEKTRTRAKKFLQTTEYIQLYHYDISDDDTKLIISKLDKKYITNYDDWIKLTTFLKILDKKTIWEELGKDYDQDKNEYFWNSVGKGINYSIVEYILKEVNMLNRLVYYKYKPTIKDKIQSNNQLLNRSRLGINFFKYRKNYVIKSDTGTGKTTSVKHFLKYKNFVSIVSRVSLAEEQYKIFSNFGIDCNLYLYEQNIQNNMNVIICLDSIQRLYNINFGNKIVFLDEFSSIIEYLITSETLINKRVVIFKLFIKILRECKNFICVDADINDNCFKILEYLGKEYEYYVNIYKYNKNIKCKEYLAYDNFINDIKNEDKFILTSDSKKECEVIYKLLDDKDITLYTSDTVGSINLDISKKVIYSPKVIYGLDSLMDRNVYCLYTGKTITPNNMVQQICRCRNIKEVRYIFTNKKVLDCKFYSREHIKATLANENNMSINEFKILTDEATNSLYLDMLEYVEYNRDAYNTNMFLHFKKLLKDRGFDDEDNYHKTVTMEEKRRELKEEILEDKIEGFNIKDPVYQMINDLLRIPESEVEKFKDYFISKSKLYKHFNICNFFFKEDLKLKKDLMESKEFNVNIIKTNKRKILLLSDMLRSVGLEPTNLNDISVNKTLTKEAAEKYKEQYKTIYRHRGDEKELDFTDNEITKRKIIGMMNGLFGEEIVDKKKVQNKKKRIRRYQINEENVKMEEILYNFRKPIGKNTGEFLFSE